MAAVKLVCSGRAREAEMGDDVVAFGFAGRRLLKLTGQERGPKIYLAVNDPPRRRLGLGWVGSSPAAHCYPRQTPDSRTVGCGEMIRLVTGYGGDPYGLTVTCQRYPRGVSVKSVTSLSSLHRRQGCRAISTISRPRRQQQTDVCQLEHSPGQPLIWELSDTLHG